MLQTVSHQQRDLISTHQIRKEQYGKLEVELAQLRDQLAALQLKFNQVNNEVLTHKSVLAANETQLVLNREVIVGLGLRCLKKDVVLHIFSYLIGDSSRYKQNRAVYNEVIQLMLVSKYWLKLIIHDILKVNKGNNV